MSFVYDIRNLKNCSDYKAKRQDFFKMLRLQAKLNRNYEQATIARQQMETLGITPVMQARRSIEDEQQDLMLQQQLAIKNLKGIMSDDEVMRTIHMLSDSDVYFLNTEFGRMSEFLKGRMNITADFVKRVLERFKIYLESTGGTGVPIPLRESTLHNLTADLRDDWENYSKRAVDPTTSKPFDLDDLINRTAEVLNRDVEDVKEEVESETKMDVDDVPSPMEEAPTTQPEARGTKRGAVSKQNLLTKRPRTMEERMMKRKADELEGLEISAPKKMRTKKPFLQPSDDDPFDEDDFLSQYPTRTIPIADYSEEPNTEPPRGTKRVRDEIGRVLPEKKGRVEPTSAVIRGVKRQNELEIEDQSRKMAMTGALTLDQARALARAQLAQRTMAYVPPKYDSRIAQKRRMEESMLEQAMQKQKTGRLTLDEAKRLTRAAIEQRAQLRASEIEQGRGLYVTTPQRTTQEYGAPTAFSKYSHGAGMRRSRRKVGAGIEPTEDVRYREFGKFMIHIPSLNNGKINIKHINSVQPVSGVEQRYVSKEFVKMVNRLLDDGEFDRYVFYQLPRDEQEYFYQLACKCKFKNTIGLGKEEEQELTKGQKEDMERFELLRGTIVAGNNSPEVIQELRKYILKFLKENRISPKQGHELLYEMSALEVC